MRRPVSFSGGVGLAEATAARAPREQRIWPLFILLEMYRKLVPSEMDPGIKIIKNEKWLLALRGQGNA